MTELKGAKLYAYIGSKDDYAPEQKQGQWVELKGIHLLPDECIRKLSWRADDWGGNNVVLNGSELNKIVGKVMTICDAMLTDKDQKEAFKQLLKDTIYGWHDDVFNRFQLDVKNIEE